LKRFLAAHTNSAQWGDQLHCVTHLATFFLHFTCAVST
jgi:hypothetical protein